MEHFGKRKSLPEKMACNLRWASSVHSSHVSFFPLHIRTKERQWATPLTEVRFSRKQCLRLIVICTCSISRCTHWQRCRGTRVSATSADGCRRLNAPPCLSRFLCATGNCGGFPYLCFAIIIIPFAREVVRHLPLLLDQVVGTSFASLFGPSISWRHSQLPRGNVEKSVRSGGGAKKQHCQCLMHANCSVGSSL